MSQTFADNLLPSATGYDLGSATQQWDVFAQNVTVSGTASFTGTLAITELEDIRFADQFAGGSVTAKIDAALGDATNLVVLVPTSMGAGDASSISTGKSIVDLRGGLPKWFTNYSVSSAAWQINDAGTTIMAAMASNTANVASAGQVRLASADTIKFRNNGNTADILGLSKDASDIVQLGDVAGGRLAGPLVMAGALSGVTTLAASGVITSTLATGTAPFTLTSTTLVSNLNVARLNSVVVSGTPSANQVLQATSGTAATWAAVSGTGYTYNASRKRWELFDSTIATWLQDVQPGYKLDGHFVGAVASTDVILHAGNGSFGYSADVISANNYFLQIRTTAGANNIARITSHASVGHVPASNLQCFWFVVDPVQSDANTTQRVGFSDFTSSYDPPDNGIYLERLGTDTNWFLVTRNASTSTRGDTGIAHAAGKVGFIVVKDGTTTVKCYQSGSSTALATNSTNIPTDANVMAPFGMVKTLTTAAKNFNFYLLRATGISATAGY